MTYFNLSGSKLEHMKKAVFIFHALALLKRNLNERLRGTEKCQYICDDLGVSANTLKLKRQRMRCILFSTYRWMYQAENKNLFSISIRNVYRDRFFEFHLLFIYGQAIRSLSISTFVCKESRNNFNHANVGMLRSVFTVQQFAFKLCGYFDWRA
ncbi:hypothetical protein BY458DRAFT_494732 [Sporodiniella umbellata]|nr:hypothetical protein BY458DRAFT_494732 [Sporodiniella umbellata]